MSRSNSKQKQRDKSLEISDFIKDNKSISNIQNLSDFSQYSYFIQQNQLQQEQSIIGGTSDMQKKMAIEMAGSIKVNKDEISNLKKGNVLYYRLVSSQKILFGKLVCVTFDSKNEPQKLLFEKKPSGIIERELLEISELYKKPGQESFFEIERLNKLVKEQKNKIVDLHEKVKDLTIKFNKLVDKLEVDNNSQSIVNAADYSFSQNITKQ